MIVTYLPTAFAAKSNLLRLPYRKPTGKNSPFQEEKYLWYLLVWFLKN